MESKLKRTLNFKDITILAFSTMIGWGWVTLTGNFVVAGGGIGATVAFLVGAILCIFVGLVYCELTPALPYAGGEVVFAYRAMGYHASWLTGWMITFAYVGVASWEGPALATAIDYIVPIPRYGYIWTVAGFDVYLSWLVIPIVAGAILMIINFRGIKVSSIFQAIVTGIMALGGVAFVIVSFVNRDISTNAVPMFTTKSGVFSVILAAPVMFVGFDVIPQAAEEMNIPLKRIPKAIIAAICIAAAWYISMILSAFISAPTDVLREDGISIANTIVHSTGNPIMGKFIVFTAIMGIITSWNGFIIGATRVLYSMGRARMLPRIFGTVQRKYKTPYFATLFVGIITVITPFLGKNSLGWFVNASAFGTVIAYLMVTLSFIILRYREPELNRPYKVKYGKLVGFIAILISVFFITLYLPIGASSLTLVEWIIVLCWVGFGAFLYVFSIKGIKRNKDEREEVLYGGDKWK